jgi:glycolate oxidase FAD binding subunit
VRDFAAAERQLAAIVDSATAPAAVELLAGSHWREHPELGGLTAGCVGWLVVGLEGTAAEVEWMLAKLADEWHALGAAPTRSLVDKSAQNLWRDLREFPATEAPLVIKAGVLPGRTTDFMRLVWEIDPQASIQAHAGNGIVIARFARFETADVSRHLIGRLHPAAVLAGGGAVVLSSTFGGLTRPAVWGNATSATAWMDKVKREFDPKNLLNRGRFVYDF